MNDFTKEELESMINWANVYTEFGMSWAYRLNKPLMDKIQSMIDNYDFQEIKLWHCEKCGDVQ